MQQRQMFKRWLAFLCILLVVSVFSGLVSAQDTDASLLVWLGTGKAPGSHSPSSPGQIVLMDSTGAIESPVLDVPQGASRVAACGNEATSPDGQQFAFFVGGEAGTLYMMTGKGTPTPVIENVQAMACAGSGTFSYSPDSSHYAFIAFEAGAGGSEFPDGWLHIGTTSSKADVHTVEGVTAFDIGDKAVAYVRFFVDDQGRADEAGIFLWNGENDTEVATIFPNEDCKFTSGQIGLTSEERMVLVMGHRCNRGDTRTSWQFYVVDASSRSASLSMSDFQVGSFASFARTNNLIFSPDNAAVYYTIPDGFTTNTVALTAVNLTDMTPAAAPIIASNAVMPKSDNTPYDLGENATPMISPDGRWLAVVTNTANGNAALNVVDLSDMTAVPFVLPAGSRGETVASLSFTPDSKSLIFVAGGKEGGENSLWGIVPANAEGEFRIARGRFGPALVSPDGATVAAMEWVTIEDPKEPPYLTLSLVDAANGAKTVLFAGATIVEGKVTDQKFAYPLAWR